MDSRLFTTYIRRRPGQENYFFRLFDARRDDAHQKRIQRLFFNAYLKRALISTTNEKTHSNGIYNAVAAGKSCRFFYSYFLKDFSYLATLAGSLIFE